MSNLDFVELCETELGIKFSQKNSGKDGAQATGLCPLHEDTAASFAISAETGLWKCFNPSCKGADGGNYDQLHMLVTGKENPHVPEVPEVEVTGRHFRLCGEPAVLKWLEETRGIDRATVDLFKLGYDPEGRIAIPIYLNEKCVNIRRHAIKKVQAGVKTVSWKAGFGGLQIFARDQNMASGEIFIMEGEMDALLANRLGFPAISVTGGAGGWKPEWNQLFKDKIVNIVYDIDKAGLTGSLIVARELQAVAKLLRNIRLPITQPANGDFTDYIMTYGASADDFRALVDATDVFEISTPTSSFDGERPAPIVTDLSKASHASMIGKLVKMRVTTAGKDLAPYACPKDVVLTCNMGLKICKLCSIAQAGGRLKHTVQPLSLEIIKLINCTDAQQKQFIVKAAGVYPGCPRFEMKAENFHTVEDVRLVPEINFSSQGDAEYVMRPAFSVGTPMRTNSSYEVEALVVPDPNNQYVTYLMDKVEQVKDNIEGFTMTPEIVDKLKAFQPAAGQTVKDKFTEIARDLEMNVTHIYQRSSVIMATDLIYHSVLGFRFQGRPVKKGWTELLLIGDTRCGKTETVTSLIQHYRAGEFATGENCSYAGLIGGMQQVGTRWSITWGKLPLNDRRLLVVDEVSGMPVEDLGKMSGVRSSGIAEVTKVQSEKTFARTRMIWIGNPRSPRPLSTYDAGVTAIKELIGRPEDVARFDLAVAVASGEVPDAIINQTMQEGRVPHIFTTELCHDLVMWGWSRTLDQVDFTAEAEKLCLILASNMGKNYSPLAPLVEPAEQRIKLARLSVACAVRLFSTEDGYTVKVLPEHVQFVHDFLDEIYSSPALGYRAWSKLKIQEMTLKDEGQVLKVIEPYGIPLVEGLMERSVMKMQDLEDLLGMDRKDVKPVVSGLVQQRAFKHVATGYVKSPAFIQLLKRLQSDEYKKPAVVAGTEI
jgi:hypothetical protein